MSMFDDIPVGVGIIYEGERIRGKEMQVELGGPREQYKFELVQARMPDEVQDGKINIIGPDLPEMKPGSNHPFGLLIEVAGKEIEKDLEGVIERRIHEYMNFIEGFMHLNQRYDIQLRLSKKSYEKGLNGVNVIGKVLQRLFKSEMPFIEKIQITFMTEPGRVKEWYEAAMKIYDARDARARGMSDDDVEVFYGCSLCQSFAPTHLCVITPQRYANCGAISWFDGRATAKIDPKGPVFEIPKGAIVNPEKGEYEGVNKTIRDKSLGEIQRVELYTAFGYPHTSCGCFEGCAFYIPELDGFGVVHRNFKGQTVNGLDFVTISDLTAGGRQVDGFHGLSIEYMRSPKFLSADGGWNRVVWMPMEVKERVRSFMPPDIVDKIPTEKDVSSLDELRSFLKEKDHPIIKRMASAPEAVTAEAPSEITAPTLELQPGVLPIQGIPSGMGIKIILKNAKIRAEKMIIKIDRGK